MSYTSKVSPFYPMATEVGKG